ncbi:MAG: chromate transporter [Bacillota bacterium]
MGAIDTDSTVQASKEKRAPYLSIFWSFFKIGAFTFGGGWAMIPLIRKELVTRQKWLEDSEFVDLLAVAQSGPGPIAVNTATITGYKMRGLPGSVAAVAGASLPSFLVILAFATVLVKFRSAPVVEAVFLGMRPAILGLLVAAVWQVGKNSLKSRRDLWYLAGGAILLFGFDMSPVAVVALAALAGIGVGLAGRQRKEKAGDKGDGHE